MENQNAPLAGMPTQGSKVGLIGLSVALLVIGLIAGYAIGKRESNDIAFQTTSPMATPSITISPNASTPPEWKLYTNARYAFELKYPSTYVITKTPPGYVTWKDGTGTPVVYVSQKSGGTEYWGDTDPVGNITLGEVTGKKFVYRLCDALSCTPMTIAYVVERPSEFGNLFALEFPGDDTIDATESQILSSFKFTK